MKTSRPGKRDESLRSRTLLRLAAGALLALAACAVALPGSLAADWHGVAMMGLGIAAATVVRGFELRAWFGRALSLHQSQSLQAVLDFARWSSPLQDRRRFEAEIIARETAEAPDLIAEWSRSRQWWRAVLLPALPATVSTVIVPSPVLALGCWALTLVAGYATAPGVGERKGSSRRSLLHRHAVMTGCALAGLLIEAATLRLAMLAMFPAEDTDASAAALFIAFGLARAVPVASFAAGWFELMAFGGLALAAVPSAVSAVLVVHGWWILLASVLGVVYLPRYKLSFADLFDRRLPALLAQSRRPAAGWAAPVDTDPATVDLSVAIPAYNERERLPRFLPGVLEYLRNQGRTWEVVVSDDGSNDGTGDYVAALAANEAGLRLVRRPHNGGKGRAVLDAVEAARGRYVLLADADGAIPIHEIEALWTAVSAGAEIAIGSRAAVGANRVRRSAGRALLGRTFYMLVNFLAVPGIGDTQCGFKLLRRDVARALFRELGEHGWAFDVEVLYRAQIAGYRVAEVGVEVHDVAGSKLNPLRDAVRMFVSLFRIRARNAGFTSRTAQLLLAERGAPQTGRSA